MSARTPLVVLAGIALAGVVMVWIREGRERAPAPSPATGTAEGAVAGGTDLVSPAEDGSPDAPTEASRTAPEATPRFDLDRPRILSVVLTVPAETPAGERPTLVLTAWKSDGSELGALGRHWGEWTEVDRLEDAEPGSDLALEVPRDAEAVRVHVEAEYLYLPDGVELDELHDPAPLRLDLELAGRLRFRLVPPHPTALDPRVLEGTGAELHYRRTDVWASTGPPTFLPLVVGEDLVAECGGLRPDYEYTLEGHGPPFAPYRSEGVRAAPGETVELDVPLVVGIDVHGRVLGPDGEPMPGARLWAESEYAWGGSGGRAYDVDERGEFHLLGLDPGLTELSASADGFYPASVERRELPTTRIIEGVELRLGIGKTIAGAVLFPDGRPVSGASVELRGSRKRPGIRHAKTNEEGRFRFTGLGNRKFHALAQADFDGTPPAGVTVVSARRSSSGGWRAEATVSGGDEAVELRLVAPVALVGRAVDDAGAAVAKVHLSAVPDRGGAIDRSDLFMSDHETTLDTDDGEFRWEGLSPGRWVVAASATGYSEPPPVRVEIPSDDPTVFVFHTRLRLTGRILDPIGAPVPGARLEGVELRGGMRQLGAVHATADEEGAFEVDVDAAAYQVFATADGYALSEPLDLTVVRGVPIEPLELTLRDAGRLDCEVRDRAGDPVPGTGVQIEGLVSASWPNHQTDAGGRLVIEDLAPGTYSLSSWFDGPNNARTTLRTSAEVRAGETTHVVLGGPLEVRLTVRGTVTSGGTPLTGWQVKIDPRDPSASPGLGRTDESGHFEVALELGGPAIARLSSDRGLAHHEAVVLPESGEHELLFELPTAGLRGRVVHESGPLPFGFQGHVLPAGGPTTFDGGARFPLRIARDGTFEALHLEPGAYVIVVGPHPFFGSRGDEGDAVGGASCPVTLVAGEVVEGIELSLAAAGVLEVDVVDEDGEPIAGAAIHAYDAEGRPLTTRPIPCEGGHASIATLPPGEVRLVASTGDRVSARPIAAHVSAGEVNEVEIPTVLGATLELRLAEGIDTRGLALSVRDDSGWDVGRGFEFLPNDPTRRVRVLRPLPPGGWTVRLTAPDGTSAVREVELAPGERRVVEIESLE